MQGRLAARIFENVRLARQLEREAPVPAAAVEFAGPVEVLAPNEGERVSFQAVAGQVTIRWSGPPQAGYRLEYRVGQGKHRLEGAFDLTGNSESFGPFNRVFWRSLTLYNPFSFRVVPAGRPELASPWRTFTFE